MFKDTGMFDWICLLCIYTNFEELCSLSVWAILSCLYVERFSKMGESKNFMSSIFINEFINKMCWFLWYYVWTD